MNTLLITNPLHPYEDKQSISSVLRDLATEDYCDGTPYVQMIEAADYIDTLEKQLLVKSFDYSENFKFSKN